MSFERHVHMVVVALALPCYFVAFRKGKHRQHGLLVPTSANILLLLSCKYCYLLFFLTNDSLPRFHRKLISVDIRDDLSPKAEAWGVGRKSPRLLAVVGRHYRLPFHSRQTHLSTSLLGDNEQKKSFLRVSCIQQMQHQHLRQEP